MSMIVPLLSHHVKGLGASPTVAGVVGKFISQSDLIHTVTDVLQSLSLEEILNWAASSGKFIRTWGGCSSVVRVVVL